VPASAFEVVPEFGATLRRLLKKLDDPVLRGADPQARAALAAAQRAWADTDADYERGPDALPWVESLFRAAAERLEQARDPLTSDAWLGAARASRYQPDHRNKTLETFIDAPVRLRL